MPKEHPLVETVIPVVTKPTFRLPLEEMTLHEKVDAYVALDRLEKTVAARKKQLNEDLKGYTEQAGDPVEGTGHKRVNVNGTTLTRECRPSKTPELEKLLALCKKKKIAKKDQPLATQKQVVFDPSKLGYLISTGRLTQEDVKDLFPVLYALTFEASDELKLLMKVLSESPAIEVEDLPVQAEKGQEHVG